jgi:mitogen-activated protein kinase 7
MGKQDLSALFPNGNPDALDLLDHMLAFDPSSRISVEIALGHPYLKIWRNTSDEPDSATRFDFEFESEQEVSAMRAMITKEVLSFRQYVRIQPS